MSGGGGSAPASQTVTQVQQIPQFEQDFAQSNEDIAASIASQPYPTYQGQLIAGFTPQQTAGMNMAGQAATAYQPDVNAAENMTMNAANSTWNPATAAQYMSPYAMAAMAPQIQQLQQQAGIQNNQLAGQATSAGAFGDARQGVQASQNNFNNNLALNDLVSQGMNTAYNTGMSAFQNAQQTELQGAGQMASLGSEQQSLGETGANAMFSAGSQQQQMTQEQLTEAYNNFMNQVNWPTQGLNERIAALANTPYTQANYTSLAPSNSTAQNVGAFAGVSGLLGNLLNGGSGSSGGTTTGISPTPIASDIRLKKNLKLIGKTKKHNLPIYSFNYVWSTEPHVGIMAQDVEKIMPEAVTMHPAGYKMVNYSMVA